MVPDKRFKRKDATDNVVKQALAAWGDSSSESEADDDQGDSSMMAVESEAVEYDSIFALLEKSENDDDDDDEETIESLKKEKDALTKKIANIKYERDDLEVVVVDLKETTECVKKEKEVLTEKVANIEHERDDLLVVVVELNKTIEELEKERISQQWYMDSGCSKHMIGSTNDFLSLKALQGGSVFFRNGKKGYILGVRRIGKSLSHSIENVYYVNGLNNLLSVSQICDKGNKVEFVSNICTVTNLVTGEVVLVAK
ncbi:uncharacterized protein [Nicotiana sylvestris]|uniref:uncharacterized protein n=1 Tax=Nicotiana sylvestris TaxID=4096 RepID=UPI00388C6FAE